MVNIPFLEQFGKVTGDVTGRVVEQQSRLVHAIGLVAD